MKRNNEQSKKHRRTGVASGASPRYNGKEVPAPTPTLGDFHTEDQALEYLAEILVTAYFQEKSV